jgi:hypothetical protein
VLFGVDKSKFEIRLDGRRLDLTTTEFRLLTLLIERRFWSGSPQPPKSVTFRGILNEPGLGFEPVTDYESIGLFGLLKRGLCPLRQSVDEYLRSLAKLPAPEDHDPQTWKAA